MFNSFGAFDEKISKGWQKVINHLFPIPVPAGLDHAFRRFKSDNGVDDQQNIYSRQGINFREDVIECSGRGERIV